MNFYNHKNHEKILNIKYDFNYFWIMFYKLDKDNISINHIADQINNFNSKYFPVMYFEDTIYADPFLFKYKDEQYVFFEKINI
jgi:hypothetical protein